MPDTQVERISQLDIGDGKLYEFAGANNGMVFNNVTDALAAIQAGTVANGDVFYIKNDGTSGYPVFIGTSAQITTADNAGKIPAGMLIFCTDDSVNDITALQVSYGNTTVKAKLDDIIDNLGNTDISGIGDGSVKGAISSLNSDLGDIEDLISSVTLDTSTSLNVNTDYLASNDGYLYVSSATSANAGVIRADIKDGNNNEIAQIIYRNSPSNADVTSVYVKKGLHIKLTDKGGNSSAYFRILKK